MSALINLKMARNYASNVVGITLPGITATDIRIRVFSDGGNKLSFTSLLADAEVAWAANKVTWTPSQSQSNMLSQSNLYTIEAFVSGAWIEKVHGAIEASGDQSAVLDVAGAGGADGEPGDDGADGARGTKWFVGTGAPDAVAAWNPSDKAAGVTLSSANHLASSTAGNNSVRGLPSHNAGKWYLEFDVTAEGGGLCGIGPADFNLNDNTFGNSICLDTAGNIRYFGLVNTDRTWGPYTGKNIGMAIDWAAHLVWFRYNGGDWLQNAAADPATGVGGFNVGSALGTMFPLTWLQNNATTRINTGDTAFAHAAPAGFNSWSGAPSGMIEGDFFLESVTGDVYEYVGSAWTGPVANLKGPAGADA